MEWVTYSTPGTIIGIVFITIKIPKMQCRHNGISANAVSFWSCLGSSYAKKNWKHNSNIQRAMFHVGPQWHLHSCCITFSNLAILIYLSSLFFILIHHVVPLECLNSIFNTRLRDIVKHILWSFMLLAKWSSATSDKEFFFIMVKSSHHDALNKSGYKPNLSHTRNKK